MKILIIDDNPLVCKMIKKSGEYIGIDVDYAYDEFMVNKKEKYDLILIDFMMKTRGDLMYDKFKDVFINADFVYYTSIEDIPDKRIPVIHKIGNPTVSSIIETRTLQCAL